MLGEIAKTGKQRADREKRDLWFKVDIKERVEEHARTFRNKDWVKNILLVVLLNSGTDINKIKRMISLITTSEEEREKINKAVEEVFSKSNAENLKEREKLWDVFEEFGINKEEIINSLVKMLNDKDENVRKRAVEYLMSVNDLGYVLAGAFNKEWFEKSGGDYNKAVEVAKKMEGEEREKLIGYLLGEYFIKSEDDGIRERTCKFLGDIGFKDEEIIKTLLERLKDKKEEVRAASAKALGELGVASKEVIDALIGALGDWYSDVKKASAEALGKIAKKNKIENEIVERILPGVNSTNLEERWGACLALGELGAASKEVIDALLERLKDGSEKPGVKEAAAWALGELGAASKEVINALVKRLNDKKEESWVKKASAEALGKLGVPNDEVINALIGRLKDKDEYSDVRTAAAEALGELGVGSDEVINALVGRLRDKNEEWWVKEASAKALGNLGVASKEVIDALVKALDYWVSDVKKASAEALGKLGVPNDEVINALIERLNDKYEDYDVRKASKKALKQIAEKHPEVREKIKRLWF